MPTAEIAPSDAAIPNTHLRAMRSLPVSLVGTGLARYFLKVLMVRITVGTFDKAIWFQG